MTSARAEARPRAGAGGAWWPALGIAAIWIFLGVFLVYPLARIFYDAFSDDAGRLTVRHFVDFATDGFYRRSLWNSLVLGLGTVAATSVLGFSIALLLVRYDFVGRSLFSNLTLIPIVAPPLVGVLLVFICTFSAFAPPLVLAPHDLRPGRAYQNTARFGARRLFRRGIVISAFMAPLAVLFLTAARRYVAIKDYSSLSYSRVARRRLSPARQALAVLFLSLVMLASFIPYAGVLLASVGRGWSMTPIPVQYTLQFFERVIVETPKYIVNSFLYSTLAVLICIVVGVPIAWLLARTRVPGRDVLDGLNTLILAVPGTAIGIAYVRAFHEAPPGFERGLTSFWIILPLVLAIRRLPYTVRGSYASLLLVHRSMEEAAASVGAGRLRSFRDITLPLMWRGILVGSLFSFMTSLQEASAVLFLSLGGWETITVGIFSFYIAGSASEAAALGVILLVVAAVTVLVINRVAGTRMGGMFG